MHSPIIRICANQDEYLGFFKGGNYFSLNDLEVTTYQDYDTAAASLYFQGMSLFAYADMAYEIPPPKGLSEEELDIYRETVDKTFRIPAEDAGKARLLSALEKARAEKRWCEWNTKTVIALNERYPSEFPSERQEARGAILSGTPTIAGPEAVPQTKGGGE